MIDIILDCDPGLDDAIALLLATRADDIRILGVTTVAGNSALSHTTMNALRVLNFSGVYDIPVYAGCAKPMMRPLYRTGGAAIHGEDGLGGYKLPMPRNEPEATHAVDYIIKTLRSSDDQITVVAIGPLTNIATAMVMAPDITKKIERLVIMGGAAVAPGNITSAAEFNIYVDPEAASIVFKCGCPIYLNALDVTMKAVFYEKDINRLNKKDNPVSQMVYDLLKFYSSNCEEHFGFPACPIHDALCIGMLIDDSLVSYRDVFCDVSLHDELTLGETVCDLWNVTGKRPNINLSTRVDREKFAEIVITHMRKPYISKIHDTRP